MVLLNLTKGELYWLIDTLHGLEVATSSNEDEAYIEAVKQKALELKKRAEPEAAKESETQMSEETKRCPCYNDPCDPEGCNGSTKEFVDGRCLQVLHRDMKKDPDWREWVEYVIEKSFYADQERKEIACYDRMFEEIERKSAAPEAANHDPQLTEEK